MAGFQRLSDGINASLGFSDNGAKRDRNGRIVGNLYYNANIVAVPPYNSNLPKSSFPAAFSDTRNGDLFKNTQNFHVSLVRCGLTTKDLPAFIPSVAPNPDDPTDINYLDYRVGVQMTTSGSVMRASPELGGLGSGESGVILSCSDFLSQSFSQPITSYFPTQGTTTSLAPFQVSWALDTTKFTGNIQQKQYQANDNCWINQLNAATTVNGSNYLAFSVTDTPPYATTGTFQGGSGQYLVITSTYPGLVKIDFSVHGSYNPSGLARVLGIPVGTIIELMAVSGSENNPSYTAPLGVLTGPGSYGFTLSTYRNLKWVPEDLSVDQPDPPSATGAPASAPYYYSYNISSFLDNVVNPGLELVVRGPVITTGYRATDLRYQSLETQKTVYLKTLVSGPSGFSNTATVPYTQGQMVYYPTPTSSVVGKAWVAQYNVPNTSPAVYPGTSPTLTSTVLVNYSVSNNVLTLTPNSTTGYLVGFPLTIANAVAPSAAFTGFSIGSVPSTPGATQYITFYFSVPVFSVNSAVAISGIAPYTYPGSTVQTNLNQTYVVTSINAGISIVVAYTPPATSQGTVPLNGYFPTTYPTSTGTMTLTGSVTTTSTYTVLTPLTSLNNTYTILSNNGTSLTCAIAGFPNLVTSSGVGVVLGVASIWAPLASSAVAIPPDPTTTTTWVSTVSYAMGAGAQEPSTGLVYVALTNIPANEATPALNPSWARVGQSVQNSWVSQVYPANSFVTYQGLAYFCVASTTTGSPPTNSGSWTLSNDAQVYPTIFTQIQVDGTIASDPPRFVYNSTNLFDLVMDTYSLNGAEDSLGLSGGAPILTKGKNMNPVFESMNLVSDVAVSNLFASFKQTRRSTTTTNPVLQNVPVLWGGTTSIDPAQTSPSTLATLGYTSSSSTQPPHMPSYADRLARLGIVQPYPNNYGDGPQFPNALSFPSRFLYALHQQYESTSTIWCPVDAIVITSNNIPMKKELVGNPTYVPSTSPSSVGLVSTAGTAQILTDFSVSMQNNSDYRSFTLYIPTGEYRRISMASSGAFPIISFMMWWRNRLTQTLVPVTLSPGGSCNLKFLFEPID